MDVGMVGLGKMGGNMARRLLGAGHRVVGFDVRPEAVEALGRGGGVGVSSLEGLAGGLAAPRSVWLMLPAGETTQGVLEGLAGLLQEGDTLIDGGNSYYRDSQRRGEALGARGLHFLDVGMSGGIWGLMEGYSLMIGGHPDVVERHRPLFETLAPARDKGWGRVGPVGAGHFVKMVHNAIEYGLMEAYAEGFEILAAKKELHLNLGQVAEIWRYGSVVRSWLLDLAADLLADEEELRDVRGWVPDTGEGRWAVLEAIDLDLSAPVITQALERRLRSRQAEPFSDKLLAALRGKFGGHEVLRRPEG